MAAATSRSGTSGFLDFKLKRNMQITSGFWGIMPPKILKKKVFSSMSVKKERREGRSRGKEKKRGRKRKRKRATERQTERQTEPRLFSSFSFHLFQISHTKVAIALDFILFNPSNPLLTAQIPLKSGQSHSL